MSTELLLYTAATFLLAGFVKGVIGMGMPTVSLAMLSLAMGLPAAVQIMVVPTIVTNIWQAFIGDGFARLLRRFWSLLAATMAGVWVGYVFLFLVNPKVMTAVLGAAIGLYSASGLLGFSIMPRVKRESLASPLVGVATGVLAGATGNISMPAIAYFQRLDLNRHELVQMLGILFTFGTAMLGLVVAGHGNYQRELLIVSALAVIPGIAGMRVGQAVRTRLSERAFRRALYLGLLAVAVHLIWKGLS